MMTEKFTDADMIALLHDVGHRMLEELHIYPATSMCKAISDRIASLTPHKDVVPPDVIRLVIAAREVAFSGGNPREAIKELDAASESFASRVPWEDEPEDTRHHSALPLGASGKTCRVQNSTSKDESDPRRCLTPTMDAEELAQELTTDIYDPPVFSARFDEQPEVDWATLNKRVKEKIQAALTAAEQRGSERGKADSAKIAEGQCHLAKDGLSIAHRIRNMKDAAPSPANSDPVKS